MNKAIEVILPSKKEAILCAIGDTHIGAKACDKLSLQQSIDEIKHSRKSYVILMGDLLDAIVSTDKRYNQYEVDPDLPKFKDQVDYALKVFKPIKKKIIGVLEGNHEYKIRKRVGYDFCEYMADEFDANYMHQSGMLILKMPFRNVRVFALHGIGGASTVGGQLTRVRNAIRNFKDAPEIALVGHFHRLDSIPLPVMDDDLGVHKRQVGFTGSYYRTYVPGFPSYASDKLYPPSIIGYQRYRITEGSILPDPREFLDG